MTYTDRPNAGQRVNCAHDSATLPARPTALAVIAEALPAALVELPQWVVWRFTWKDGRWTKPPFNATTSRHAQSNNPATHAGFHTALNAYRDDRKDFDGIGFAFHKNDGLTGIDLDHVIDPATGELSPDAAAIVDAFRGTYCEISPSGDGIRIFCRGQARKTGKNKGKWLEVYGHTSPRYLTATGHRLPGTADDVTDQQAALDWLHTTYMAKPEATPQRGDPAPASGLALSDADLLEKARTAHTGDRFSALFDRGNTSAYGGDDSAADLALCNLLAFWTDHDADRMDRLFRQSALMRKKWNRTDYRQWTLNKAITACGDTYTGPRPGGNGHGHQPPAAELPPLEAYEQDTRPVGPGADSKTAKGNHREKDTRPVRERLGIKTLADIGQIVYPPERYAVPGIVPEGLTLLAGPPKVKKSWLALGIGVAVALGGVALGKVPVEQGGVLYLALEDRERRLQKRTKAIQGDLNQLTAFDVATAWRRLDKGGLDDLRAYLSEHATTRVVIVDTLALVRPRPVPGESSYDADYRAIALLKSVADEFGVCMLVITHTRKQEADDFLAEVTGTYGVSGAADGVLILKRARCSDTATLSITGRDIEEEREVVLTWHSPTCTWHLTDDNAAEVRMTPERRRIIEILRESPTPLSSKQIATLFHGKEMIRGMPEWQSTRTTLSRMLANTQLWKDSTDGYTLPITEKHSNTGNTCNTGNTGNTVTHQADNNPGGNGVTGVTACYFDSVTQAGDVTDCFDNAKVGCVTGVTGVTATGGVGTIDTPRPSAPLGDDARRVYQWFLDTKAAGWLTCRELVMNTGMDIGRVQSAATELNSHKVALFMNGAVRVPPVEARP